MVEGGRACLCQGQGINVGFIRGRVCPDCRRVSGLCGNEDLTFPSLAASSLPRALLPLLLPLALATTQFTALAPASRFPLTW